MTTLFILLFAITILLLAANLFVLIKKYKPTELVLQANPEQLAAKHILKIAIEYIHEENTLYQANLKGAIDFIESLNPNLSYYQKIDLDDLKYEELNLRTRYAPQKLEEGLVSALQEYIIKTTLVKQQLTVSLNEESPIDMPHQMLTYYYGILSIILDSFTSGIGEAAFCQVNIGQNKQMVWAEGNTPHLLDHQLVSLS
ncbi:MAG: hypothetical protein WBB45_03675 [Cyclobacteriaceae bacterium]